MRYDQLLDIIDELKPRTIVEVGVARAERALAMCLRALIHRPDVHYTGFDVFESKDEAFQAAAYNLKRVDPVKVCAERLERVRTQHKDFSFTLIVGDTRDTLHRSSVKVDLAFIDGDHRVDAIEQDYEALKKSTVVVLDDYYSADERGCPDIARLGCNRLVDRLNGSAVLLPALDQVRDGGMVQMAVIRCSGAV